MSSDSKNVFTKENLDTYLKELAKEFRKINGKSMPAEIILIGGAACKRKQKISDFQSIIRCQIQRLSGMYRMAC